MEYAQWGAAMNSSYPPYMPYLMAVIALIGGVFGGVFTHQVILLRLMLVCGAA